MVVTFRVSAAPAGDGNVTRPEEGRSGPLRGLSMLVFAVILASSITAAHVTRQMLDNQEREMLQQRAAEAAALLSSSVGQVRTSLGAVATAVRVAGTDPGVFNNVAGGLKGYRTIALVDRQGDDLILVPGMGEANLAGEPAAALRTAARGVDVVPTRVFRVGEDRRLGFALAVPGSTMLVYAERNLTDPARPRPVTSNDAFSELNGTLYATARPDPAQILITTGEPPRPGARQVTHPVRAGTETWSLLVSPRQPVLGSVVQSTPWLFLAGGLLTAILVAGLVEVLARRRRYAEGLVEERTEELREAAVHDALTHLPNRKLLVDRLELALARQLRTGRDVALLFLDLDRFKLLNDSRGHAIGDQVLVTVAERLRQVVRPSDTVARFGGDEFVVLCEGLPSPAATSEIATRLLEAVATPLEQDGRAVELTASVGIASSVGGRSRPGTLIEAADQAMYRAKRAGGGRYRRETLR
jgi:diguanylate cyclase (GGDEF)-like protein